jgi:hypothetical protein
MLDFMLSLGMVLNDKSNGGSSIADGIFGHLWWSERDGAPSLPEWISFLGAKGAKWIPEDARAIAHVRRYFYRVSSNVASSVIKALLSSGVAQPNDIKELIRTSKLHDVLGGG